MYMYRGCVNSIFRQQFVPLPSSSSTSNFHSSHLAHITSATYARCDLHWVTGFVVGGGGGIMGSVRASLIVRMNTRNIIVESCNSFEIHELAHGCSNGD